MNILFIGVACSEKKMDEVSVKYYGGKNQIRPQQNFDFNLLLGISNFCSTIAVSEPSVESYPNSNCLLFKGEKETINSNLSIKYISLLNIIGIKTIAISCSIFINTIKFCLNNKKSDSAILLGYLSFYTAIPAIFVSKLFKKNIYIIVPDLPQFTHSYSNKMGSYKRFILKLLQKLNNHIEDQFDGYVLLTKYMDDLINRNHKPSIVMEGFINYMETEIDEKITNNKNKIIMYAGTLHEKFGVKKLINSFKMANVDDCELWIFGDGDYLDEIKEESNSKIKYKGVVSRKEIIEIEKSVTLLVNPRPSTEEFTKYSFPSKTIEYMASGTPLLTTKLPGIPKEYYDYLYFFEDDKESSMAKTIQDILSLPREELKKKGGNAKDFIINNKTHIIQSKRIVDFIAECSKFD